MKTSQMLKTMMYWQYHQLDQFALKEYFLAKDAVDKKVEGLELGADDYLTKPFFMPELLHH